MQLTGLVMMKKIFLPLMMITLSHSLRRFERSDPRQDHRPRPLRSEIDLSVACRVYVYAPACRGVMSKRSNVNSWNIFPDDAEEMIRDARLVARDNDNSLEALAVPARFPNLVAAFKAGIPRATPLAIKLGLIKSGTRGLNKAWLPLGAAGQLREASTAMDARGEAMIPTRSEVVNRLQNGDMEPTAIKQLLPISNLNMAELSISHPDQRSLRILDEAVRARLRPY